ncbi:MAG: hypothetical protein NVS3B21_17630 [Acidimicrobiales bacterium]
MRNIGGSTNTTATTTRMAPITTEVCHARRQATQMPGSTKQALALDALDALRAGQAPT